MVVDFALPDMSGFDLLEGLKKSQYMEVLFAENGREGIELLKHTPDIDAILVDVMMPDLDGYETMREIRKMRRFKSTYHCAYCESHESRPRKMHGSGCDRLRVQAGGRRSPCCRC